MQGTGEWLEERLPRLLEEYGVPAAAVAIGYGDQVVDAAAGTLSTATGVAATTDAIFQVGSVTKVFTATLVQQLADEGLVDLDRPVRTYVPGLRLGDEEAAASITVRQLLTHTAGFEGDVFTDTGKGDDCLERYVDLLAGVPQLFPPGELWSYNNAGFCVLGRLIALLRGRSYDACLREHLLDPLGLTHAATDPYEAVLHRVAVGHVATASDATLHPTPTWALARSNAPAGSMLAMRARDLVAFAQHHLRTPALAAMREPQVALPAIGQGAAWGLGWEIFQQEPLIVGHDGNTIGQSAFLRVLPEHGLAVAVLTNGGDGKGLHRAVAGHVLPALAGVDLPAAPTPPRDNRTPADPTRYEGTYASVVGRTTVARDDAGRLWLHRTPLGELAEIDEPPYRTELVAWQDDADVLWPLTPEGGAHQPVGFLGDDGTGRAAYLHTGRADRRIR